jgi:acetylornithine deacetylase/succinyl-diaminopimelate desuccinylase-like protein
VLADPAEWERDPWSGELVDGVVWGRGALDMKGQVAASAVAIASLAREGFQPEGDLIFIAAADEEVGDGFGLSWLCEQHPDAVRAEYSVNEGAGEKVELGGRGYYLCASAEKMSSPFRLRVRGRSGHASVPAIADNALVKAAPLIERLGAYTPEPRIEPEVEALVRTLTGADPPPAEEIAALASSINPLLLALVQPLLALTFSPTMIEASKKRNVIPAVCDVTVDCRLLPGQTQAEAEAIIRDALGEGEWDLKWLEGQGGTRSPLETPLWDAIEEWVATADPGCAPLPVIVAGFTDSHWLRSAFGTVAYGFFPARALDPEVAALLVHSANERVPVADLELGVDFLRHAARRIGAVEG